MVGNLILFMYLIKLPKNEVPIEEIYDLNYALEDLFPEEELASNVIDKMKIETHRAYNEAEKFISESEKERSETSKTTDEEPTAINDVIEKSSNTIIIINKEKN